MFQQEKVCAFIQSAGFAGRKDKKVMRFLIYITPVTHVVATQISPDIAKALFSPDGSGKMQPALVIPDCSFDIGNIPLQQMYLHPSDKPEMDHLGAMLSSVQLSDLSARKLFPEDPNFSLLFRAEVPVDKLVVELAHKYYDEKVHLTFAAMQQQLFENTKCKLCGDPPVAKDSKEMFLCQKHVSKGIGEIDWLNKKETPKQAQARALGEATAKSAGLTMGGTVTPVADKDDATFINKRNSKKRERVH